MTLNDLDQAFRDHWRAVAGLDRLKKNLRGIRWVLLAGTVVPLGLILLAAGSPNPELGRSDLTRRWALMGAISAAFLFAWITCPRMPLRAFLSAFAVYVVAGSFLFLVWPPQAGGLKLFLWAIILCGLPVWAGVVTAFRLARVEARQTNGFREAWNHVEHARRDLGFAADHLAQARDALQAGSGLRRLVETAIRDLEAGDAPAQDMPGEPPRLVIPGSAEARRAKTVTLFMLGVVVYFAGANLESSGWFGISCQIAGFLVAMIGYTLLIVSD
jgi:hypothetical protein